MHEVSISSAAPGQGMFVLEVVQARTPPHHRLLGDRPLFIGRGPSNHVIVSPPDVSRHHAVICLKGRQLYVYDLDSPAGTWFEGNRVQRCRLSPGQLVSIGASVRVLFQPDEDLAPYTLTMRSLSLGPQARLTERSTQKTHLIGGENRTALLYVLAKRHDGGGWVADESIRTGVWGKGGSANTNHLNVLIHRVRKTLRKAGFQCILERRRGACRLRRCAVVWM